MMKKETKRFAAGAIFAGVAGYAAGILTAPKSGKETRRDVKDAAVSFKLKAEKKLKALHSEIASLLERAKLQLGKLQTSSKSELKSAINKAQKAKDHARDMLTALHEGGADDKELQKAIDDATKAAEHLRKFLTRHAKAEK